MCASVNATDGGTDSADTAFRSLPEAPYGVPMTENPFFEPWGTPFELPPFDRIRPEHFPPAFDRFMAEEAAEIDAIARSPDVPTFANALEAIARDYAARFAQHRMRIALNADLFDRVAALYAERDALALAEDQHRLLLSLIHISEPTRQ